MLIRTLKKSLVISGLTALLGMPAVQAADCGDCNEWNPCSFDYGLNPPPVRPQCWGCTWYGDIEYIYWKPYVDNAQAADLLTADSVPTHGFQHNTTNYTSTPQDFRFDWDSGFRVGLGYGFPEDKWGLSLTWTHYRTDACFDASGFGTYSSGSSLQTNVKVPLPGFLDSGFVSFLVGAQDANVVSKWNFQFNQVDLDFFRDFYVGCSLSIKPYVGLRALFLKQTVNALSQYTIVDEDYIEDLGNVTYAQYLRSDFKSFGLKAGLESYWEVVCGLGIYGNLGTSLLYAHYKTDHQLQYRDEYSTGNRINAELPFQFNTLKLTSDLAIGIEWRKPVNCNQNLIVVKGGWEHHQILNGSQFRNVGRLNYTDEDDSFFTFPKSAPTNGNISLYGFVFSVALSF